MRPKPNAYKCACGKVFSRVDFHAYCLHMKQCDDACTVCKGRQALENELYANSPFDLCSPRDNAYRDGVDAALDMIDEHDRHTNTKRS